MQLRFIVFCLTMFISSELRSQELFVYTEPASNMAAKSIGIRAANYFMRQQHSDRYNYMLAPEIMLGISKKVMIHVEGFWGNLDNDGFKANGGALYAKYRFYSEDEIHSHFRMAAFARVAINNTIVDYPAININGQNSGYEAGMIATKLINKVAISAGSSFAHATDNLEGNKFIFADKYRNALNYQLSIGKLLLPKEYTSYEQLNLNGMIELLGQANMGYGNSYLDIAPSIQFIILSKMRIDLGYRFALVKDLGRMSNDGFLVRWEYNIFNAYK